LILIRFNDSETTAFVILISKDMLAGDMDRVKSQWDARKETNGERRSSHYTSPIAIFSALGSIGKINRLFRRFRH